MRISLDKLVRQHYNDVGYIQTFYTKTGKQYLKVANEKEAKHLCKLYSNIKIAYGYKGNAPELQYTYITLK